MHPLHSDEANRREYWRQQMETAYQWMMIIRDYPIEECQEPLVSLEEAVRGSDPPVRVLFSTTKLAGIYDRLFYLRKGLIDSFLATARAMNSRGWILKVEDGYRTPEIQKALVRAPYVFEKILEKVLWECHDDCIGAELMERRVTALCATLPKIGTHISASALDISVFESDAVTEVDRGAPYLELSELTPMTSPFVLERAKENRGIITSLLADHGFVAYPFEFWHYSQGDAYDEYLNGTGKPARYGAIEWDSYSKIVQSCPCPLQPLNSREEILQGIAQALRRLGKPNGSRF